MLCCMRLLAKHLTRFSSFVLSRIQMKGRNNNEHGSTSTQAVFTYKRKFSSASVYIVFSCCKTDKRTGGPDETANKIAWKSIPIKCGDYSCSVRSFIIISDARRVFLANTSTSFVYTISQSIDSTLGYVKKNDDDLNLQQESHHTTCNILSIYFRFLQFSMIFAIHTFVSIKFCNFFILFSLPLPISVFFFIYFYILLLLYILS